MKQSGEAIAENLVRIREERNLSLDKLSDLTGVSKSMLRQIEIGQSNPTIATIWKIANGLRLPFTALIKQQTNEITLQSFKQNEPLFSDTPGYRIYPLITFDPERVFETYYLEMEPGVIFEAEPHQGNAEEHVFVTQGAIRIVVGDTGFNIEKDNFISFQANCYHQYENIGNEIVLAIMTISYLP